MVSFPKTLKHYCNRRECKTHKVHKVVQSKSGKPSVFKQGKRRYDRKQAGYGGQTKPILHKKAKTTKKILLKLQCTTCKHTAMRQLRRTKHFEIKKK